MNPVTIAEIYKTVSVNGRAYTNFRFRNTETCKDYLAVEPYMWNWQYDAPTRINALYSFCGRKPLQ